MAPKRPPPADEKPRPAVSSGDEDEASSESVDSEEEEEEEELSGPDEPQPKAPLPTPSAATARAPKSPLPAESDSESGSESEDSKGKPTESNSESDSDVTPVAAAAKQSVGQGIPQLKILKRPAMEDAAKTPSKKPNTTLRDGLNAGGEESSRKPSFQRVWSDEDEVTLLEGMIEFWEKKGLHPSTHVNQLHEFISGRLHLDFVPGQLVNKIRNCKKKFNNRSKKGKDPSFAKPTEQRAYELSKKLWGPDEGIIRGTPMPKANGTSTKKMKKTVEIPISPPGKVKDEMAMEVFDSQPRDTNPVSLCESELVRFAMGSVDESYIRKGLSLVSGSKRERLENQWKDHNLNELRVLSERARLLHELTSSIVSACSGTED